MALLATKLVPRSPAASHLTSKLTSPTPFQLQTETSVRITRHTMIWPSPGRRILLMYWVHSGLIPLVCTYWVHFGLIPLECVHAQSCLTLCNPMDCSTPGSSSLGFPKQEYWSRLPFSFSRGSSWPSDRALASCFSYAGRQILCHWVTREARAGMLLLT